MQERRKNRIPKPLAWTLFIGFIAAFLALPEIFPGNSRLYDAIQAGDLDAVERLLADGADPNSQATGLSLGRGFDPGHTGSYPPLMLAISRNEPEIARTLVLAGADPNARNPEGDTALIAAVDRGMTEVVRTLLVKGADPRAENPYDGSTALHQGRDFQVQGKPSPRLIQDPNIRAMLLAANAR